MQAEAQENKNVVVLPLTAQNGTETLLEELPVVLYKQYCIVCHAFEPPEGEAAHPNFRPIPFTGEKPLAPNLYNPIRKERIAGFFDSDKIQGSDYYGNTNYRHGAMVRYVRGELPSEIKDATDLWEVEDALDQLVDFLLSEAKRNAPQTYIANEQLELLSLFSCSQCHKTYEDARPATIQAPDLRGYMSRDWMIGIIANPTTSRFYGPIRRMGGNRMPAHHRNDVDMLMSMEEIEILVDWLRGDFTWNLPMDITIALHQNGLANVSDLAQFGNAELKGVAQGDNPFESARAKTRIEAAQAEIAQKVFWGEYAYTAPTAEVKVDGDTSSFLMVIPVGFIPHSFDTRYTEFPLSNVGVGIGRFDKDNPTDIRLPVGGSTENIEELVVSKDNYRAKVWFTNLRYENGRTSADVLKIEIVKK